MWDVVEEIEAAQCITCTFKSDRPDFPMCFEVELKLMDGDLQPETLDDQGDRVVCLRYRDEVLDEEAHPDQERLFE